MNLCAAKRHAKAVCLQLLRKAHRIGTDLLLQRLELRALIELEHNGQAGNCVDVRAALLAREHRAIKLARQRRIRC